jgi:hypothetical protein
MIDVNLNEICNKDDPDYNTANDFPPVFSLNSLEKELFSLLNLINIHFDSCFLHLFFIFLFFFFFFHLFSLFCDFIIFTFRNIRLSVFTMVMIFLNFFMRVISMFFIQIFGCLFFRGFHPFLRWLTHLPLISMAAS